MSESEEGESVRVYAILYINGVSDLDNLTVAQKTSLVERYVPQNVQESQAWINSTDGEKWAYFKDNYIPAFVSRKLIKEGLFPILEHEDYGMEIFQDWWVLASEGGKYALLVFIDSGTSLVPIRNWMDGEDGLKYWYGQTAWDAFRSLWNDRADPIAAAILRKVIRYPVETDDEGVAVEPGSGTGGSTMVIIQSALDLGYSIEEAVLVANKDRVIPFRILGN